MLDKSGEWMIRAGCKYLSIADARAYVSGGEFSGEQWLADMYLSAFDWLENVWIPMQEGSTDE